MQERPVSILCAYALERFDSDTDARLLRAVCRHHTAVVPAGSGGEAPDERSRSEHIVILQHRSRVLAALERNKRFVRGAIARRVNLKFAPDIRFRRDETFEEASRIDALLASPKVRQDIDKD